MKAYFFDRDGTLIIDKHYLSDPKQVEFLPAAFEVLKTLQERGAKIFIVTNQSGVGRGYFPVSSVLKVHDEMNRQMQEQGLKPFDDLAFCPHTPDDDCPCRKPKTAMLENLISKWNLSPKDCVMIGDKESDYQTGLNMNFKSFLLTEGTNLSQVINL